LQTPLSLAVIDVVNRRLAESELGSVHGLAKVVPSVSRSQLYLLLRGEAVIDLAELFAVCEALGVTPREVIAEAEAMLDHGVDSVAAYDDTHDIEDEQAGTDEP
jgi:transcriptional regulator with XRE-family HTH domain